MKTVQSTTEKVLIAIYVAVIILGAGSLIWAIATGQVDTNLLN